MGRVVEYGDQCPGHPQVIYLKYNIPFLTPQFSSSTSHFFSFQICQAVPVHLLDQEEEREGGAHDDLVGEHQSV